jgi:hypothetical protein
MKGKKKKSISVKRLRMANAIVKAIQRCELVCNPAIVSRPLFSIHVRKLAAGLTHSWIVSLSVNEALQLGKARKLTEEDFR